jgi:hypothetical protein
MDGMIRVRDMISARCDQGGQCKRGRKLVEDQGVLLAATMSSGGKKTDYLELVGIPLAATMCDGLCSGVRPITTCGDEFRITLVHRCSECCGGLLGCRGGHVLQVAVPRLEVTTVPY